MVILQGILLVKFKTSLLSCKAISINGFEAFKGSRIVPAAIRLLGIEKVLQGGSFEYLKSGSPCPTHTLDFSSASLQA